MSEHASDNNDQPIPNIEDPEFQDVIDVLTARAHRMLGVYELLGTAFDLMTEEIRAQDALRTRCNDPFFMQSITDDATRMAQSIAIVRDGAAGVVSAICGEHAFKTGEIQKAYYQHLIEHAKRHGVEFHTEFYTEGR